MFVQVYAYRFFGERNMNIQKWEVRCSVRCLRGNIITPQSSHAGLTRRRTSGAVTSPPPVPVARASALLCWTTTCMRLAGRMGSHASILLKSRSSNIMQIPKPFTASTYQLVIQERVRCLEVYCINSYRYKDTCLYVYYDSLIWVRKSFRKNKPYYNNIMFSKLYYTIYKGLEAFLNKPGNIVFDVAS